jgi:hypothetical protein
MNMIYRAEEVIQKSVNTHIQDSIAQTDAQA